MSVFIKIKEAQIDQEDIAEEIILKIRSHDTELVVSPVPISSTVVWNCSLISSIKQKKLEFQLSLHKLTAQKDIILKSQLSFSPLHFNPEQETSQTIVFEKNVKLCIDIFYTRKKNFLGPIQFYEYENVSTDSIIIPGDFTKTQNKTAEELDQVRSAPAKQVAKDRGFFFCCGDDFDDKRYTLEEQDERPRKVQTQSEKGFPNQLNTQNHKQAVEFYQGACQNKNLFSICDAGVIDNKFTIIEDYYRDKLP